MLQDGQNPKSPAILGPCCHKIITPDMVFPLGPQPETRAVIEPEQIEKLLNET